MIRLFTLTIAIFSVIPSLAQDEIDETKMVGFGCFYEGRETKAVTSFKKKYKRKNYEGVSKALTSGNPAERYLAVIVLEKLAAVGKHTFTEEEKRLTQEIRASEEKVGICSGCSLFIELPLNEVFSSDFLWRSEFWIERNVIATKR